MAAVDDSAPASVIRNAQVFTQDMLDSCPIRVLNDDVLLHIASLLSLKEILALASTCRLLMFLRRENHLWANLYRETWGQHPEQRKAQLGAGRFSWAEEYFWRASIQRRVMAIFNKKPTIEESVVFLLENGLVANSPDAVCEFITSNRRISAVKLGEYLSRDMQSMSPPEAFALYLRKLDLRGLSFMDAYRKMMEAIRLPSDMKRIKVIMKVFSQEYVSQNEVLIAESGLDEDGIYRVAHAALMLNADAHSPQIKNKMSEAMFSESMHTSYDRLSLPFLRDMYANITARAVATGEGITLLECREAQVLEVGTLMNSWRDAIFVLTPDSLSRKDPAAPGQPLVSRLEQQEMRISLSTKYPNSVVLDGAERRLQGWTLTGGKGIWSETEFVIRFPSPEMAEKWAEMLNEVLNTAQAVDLWSRAM